MEAAAAAAQRGHEVTLFDKNDVLGGQLLPAEMPPFKSKITDLKKYLIAQLKKNGVQVKLGEEISGEFVLSNKPEVVIIATGANLAAPDIPGIKSSHVVSALDVLTGKEDTGKEVVIIGGGMIGCEVADFLAERERKVTILEMTGSIGADLEGAVRWSLLHRVRKAGTRLEIDIEVKEITFYGVRARRGVESLFFEADTIVLATGTKSDNTLAKQLEGKVTQLHIIGDAVEPRMIGEALEEGLKIACEI